MGDGPFESGANVRRRSWGSQGETGGVIRVRIGKQNKSRSFAYHPQTEENVWGPVLSG
jgi:hypothetical protein